MILSTQQSSFSSSVITATIRECKSSKQHMIVYYCIPLEDGPRTETCSGSNDIGRGALLHWWNHSEINYLSSLYISATDIIECQVNYNYVTGLRKNFEINDRKCVYSLRNLSRHFTLCLVRHMTLHVWKTLQISAYDVPTPDEYTAVCKNTKK
jgi:hypothetical protein